MAGVELIPGIKVKANGIHVCGKAWFLSGEGIDVVKGAKRITHVLRISMVRSLRLKTGTMN